MTQASFQRSVAIIAMIVGARTSRPSEIKFGKLW
jgi:hypothetical protein